MSSDLPSTPSAVEIQAAPSALHRDPPSRRPANPRVPWLSLAVIGGLVAASIAAVGLLRPDLWVVERVVIEGQDRAGVAGLRHLADIPNGTTVWAVDIDAAASGLRQHPWVRDVEAQFEWPATVRLTVAEHQPAALLAGSSMQYVSDEGVVVAPASTDDLDYPVITGISQDLGDRHPDLPGRVVRSALELVDVLEDSGVLASQRIAEVNFSETRGFAVYVDDGPRILFALEDFDRQARRLVQLVDRGVDLGQPLHIDLAPATVAIVRPLGSEPAHPANAEVEGGEG